MSFRVLSLFFFTTLAISICPAQTTFQHLHTAAGLRLFAATELPDGGYALSGTATHPATGDAQAALLKLSCQGEPEWARLYGPADSTLHMATAIILSRDSHIVMLNNLGGPGDHDLFLLKTTLDGNTLWSTRIGGPEDDIGWGITQTRDGGFALAGQTDSYGSGPTGSQSDLYLCKLDSAGNLLWTRTYGEAGQADFARAVAEAHDGGLALTGGLSMQNALHCVLLKTDSAGNFRWAETFGELSDRTIGTDLKRAFDNGFIITGSTTLLGTDSLDEPDLFLLKTRPNGDIEWMNAYPTGPDEVDRGHSVVLTQDGNFAALGMTEDFNFIGADSRKFFAVKTDPFGSLIQARVYGLGGDDQASLNTTGDGGYIMTGNTVQQTFSLPDGSGGLMVRTDANLSAGNCNEEDVTPFVIPTDPTPVLVSMILSQGIGGISSASPPETTLSTQQQVLCEHFDTIRADFTWDRACTGGTRFSDSSTVTLPRFWAWDFGDPASGSANTATGPNPFHDYNSPGAYPVTLIVSDGCTADTLSQLILIPEPPLVDLGNDTSLCLDSLRLDARLHDMQYQWSTGDTTRSITVNAPGLFAVSVSNGCVTGTDEIKVSMLTEPEGYLLSNVFTPNDDGINDRFTLRVLPSPDPIAIGFRILIYDRWGREMYQSSDPEFEWDGLLRGRPLPEGVYFYMLRTLNCETEVVNVPGTVHLLR